MHVQFAMLGGCAALAVAVAPATAQDVAVGDAAAATVAEVPRAEPKLDMLVAYSVFAADDLDTLNITETLDILPYVPNAFASNAAGLGSANTYFIRGIGGTETIATFDPPIGTYVDGVYLARQNANNFSFFDVDRVEVLRGPQGTRFGRNTTGGAVNIVLGEPGQKLGGYIEGGYGRHDEKLLRGSLDIPFEDGTLAIKLSGYWRESDGYVDNVTTGERLNGEDASGVRVAAQLRATDRLTWSLALAKMQSSELNLLNFDCNPADAADCGGRFASTGLRKSFEAIDNQFAPLAIAGRKANYNLGNSADTWLFTSNIEWAGDNHSLSAITGYVDLKQQYAIDFFDGRAAPSLAAPEPPVRGFALGGFTELNDSHHKQFTQELRLAGKFLEGIVDYVAGLYIFSEDDVTDFADVSTDAAGTASVIADRVVVNKTNSEAVYADINVRPVAPLTITAGIRYTDETKKFGISDSRPGCTGGGPLCLNTVNLFAPSGAPIPQKQSDKLWTPRLGVSFVPHDDFVLFASATRGFKSGGWSARAVDPSELLPFGSEKVWSYEGGVKSAWFDDRLRFNVTGFYLDAADMQTSADFVRSDGSLGVVTRNFADYENKGIELEIAASPIDRLNLYASVGWQDDKYKVNRSAPAFDAFGVQSVAAQQSDCLAQLAAGQIAGASGIDNAASCGVGIVTADGGIAEPVHTPDWSLAAGASYDWPIPAAGIILTPAINAVYRSKSEVGAANLSFHSGSITGPSGTVYPSNPTSGSFLTGSESASHVVVNAGLALKTDDDFWMVRVECDNCLNESYVQSALGNFSYLSPPMTWIVRARRKF